MKKTITVVIVVLLLLSLSGCGVRQKAADKLAEKITEGILDKVSGEDVDVDLEDGKITIEGEDGSEWTVGGGEWPKDGAGAMLPVFKKGTIASVMNTPEGCWIQLDDVQEADYQQYIEELKSAGFDQNVFTTSSEDNTGFVAELEEKASLSVNYSNDGAMAITLQLTGE